MTPVPKHILEDRNHLLFARLKLKEWGEILTRKDLTKRDKSEIRKKLNAVLDIMYGTHHGHVKETDEYISKLYYSYLEDIQELRGHYELLGTTVQDFVNHSPHLQILLEFLPLDESYGSLVEKANFVLEARVQPHELAVEFTAIATELSEDRIRKKIKKIYKK